MGESTRGGFRGMSPEKILINLVPLNAFFVRFADRVSIVFVNKNDQNSDSLNRKIYQKSNFFYLFFFSLFHYENTPIQYIDFS